MKLLGKPTHKRPSPNFFVIIATLVIIVVIGVSYFRPEYTDSSSSILSSSSSPGPSALIGLQTSSMRQKMLSSCPSNYRIHVDRTMKLNPDFVNLIMDGLERVQLPAEEDPLNYIFDHYQKHMDARGFLSQGFWVEFGVWEGKTLKEAHQALSTTKFNGPIAGFDSFVGLPSKWAGRFDKGAFETNYEKVRKDVPSDILLYEGWFQDTIGTFLKDHPTVPAAVINFDADLYVSTSLTFGLLAERIIPGTILCFDELVGYPAYQMHEILALFLWLKMYDATICPISAMPVTDRIKLMNNDIEATEGKYNYGACFQVLDLKSSLVQTKMA